MRPVFIVFIFMLFAAATPAQDLSAFYGEWQGYSKVENEGPEKNQVVQLIISGPDASARNLLGEMKVFPPSGDGSVNTVKLRLDIKKLEITPSGFSFLSKGYTKDRREIPVKMIYEIKVQDGRRMLYCYGIPLKRKEQYIPVRMELAYMDPPAIQEAAPAGTQTPAVTPAGPPPVPPAAAEEPLTEGAALLFANIKSRLSNAQKNYILAHTVLVPAPDKQRFMIRNSDEYVSDVQVLITDLNNDRIDEVFVSFVSLFFGKPKTVVSLYMKGPRDTTYATHSGAVGPKPVVVPYYSQGYPDLFIPQSEDFPTTISRWDGKVYVSNWEERPVDKAAFEKIKTLSIDSLGRVYQQQGPEAAAQLLKSLPQLYYPHYLKFTPPAGSAPAAKIVYGKKGSAAKFTGKYWQLGYYDYPYTLSKTGDKFYLKRKGGSAPVFPSFTYNSKTDQLEGWLQQEDIRFKIVVEFNYDNGTLYVKPENPRLRGTLSTLHLLRYMK